MAEQLPDRGFAGAGGASAFFLFRQPFLAVPGLLASVVVFGGLLHLAMDNGEADAEAVVTLALLSPLVGFGFAVLTALPGFFLVRLIGAPKRVFEPEADEALLEDRAANHFLGREGRGGRLYLTDRRLVFLPHRFNVQLEPVELSLSAIREVGWRRVTSGRGLTMSTTVEVETEDGTEVFVVGDAEALAARIETQAAG